MGLRVCASHEFKLGERQRNEYGSECQLKEDQSGDQISILHKQSVNGDLPIDTDRFATPMSLNELTQ